MMIIYEAIGESDAWIESRVLWIRLLQDETDDGEKEWKEPAKGREGEELLGLNPGGGRTHPTEGASQVPAHHRHPGEHREVGEDTKETKEGTAYLNLDSCCWYAVEQIFL